MTQFMTESLNIFKHNLVIIKQLFWKHFNMLKLNKASGVFTIYIFHQIDIVILIFTLQGPVYNLANICLRWTTTKLAFILDVVNCCLWNVHKAIVDGVWTKDIRQNVIMKNTNCAIKEQDFIWFWYTYPFINITLY